MSAIRALIGDVVVDNSGKTRSSYVKSSSGEERVLGLYFSAHWCPPCRDFTPILVNFYESFRASDNGQQLVDIIFVSSDRDQLSFDEYVKEMPWPALPFADRERKAKLSKRFKVQGIPALVFVNANTGDLITENGRESLITDREGRNFPWYPEPLSKILYFGKLLKGNSEISSHEALYQKVKGLFFSAHWCPPCRLFTPDLINAYEKLTSCGRNFEVIYVSSDRTIEAFNEYFASMPWLAVPYGDSRITKITKHFGVKGVPMLILLDENDEVITNEGRAVISKDRDGNNFPWPTPAVEELSESNASRLNETACLILFTGGKQELIATAPALLSDVAQRYCDEQKSSRNTQTPLPEIHFLYEGSESSGVTEQLREFVFSDAVSPAGGIPQPRIAILDIPEQRYHAVLWDNRETESDPVTESSLRRLVDNFRSEKLPFVYLQR